MLRKLLSLSLIFLLNISTVGCSQFLDYAGSIGKVDSQNNITAKTLKYLVNSGDILNIEVFEEPDLSTTLRVSDEGILSYPVIGDVNVKGLNIQEVEKTLEDKLRDGYLKMPKVTVRLAFDLMKQSKEKEVYVFGKVNSPGIIPIAGEYLTALEAIFKAGGFAEFAASNRTKVVRTEDGVEKTIYVNLKKVQKGHKAFDIILRPGDVVVVPESFF
jgi:polysaccharide export outer membrane protein